MKCHQLYIFTNVEGLATQQKMAIIEGNYVHGEASQDFTFQVKNNILQSCLVPRRKLAIFGWMIEEMIAETS